MTLASAGRTKLAARPEVSASLTRCQRAGTNRSKACRRVRRSRAAPAARTSWPAVSKCARTRASARPWRSPVPASGTAPSSRSVELAQDLARRPRRSASRLHARVAREGAGHAPEVERRARAVGDALLFAQVAVDAARELPAEQRRSASTSAWYASVRPRRPEMADAQLRLRRAGPIDQAQIRGSAVHAPAAPPPRIARSPVQLPNDVGSPSRRPRPASRRRRRSSVAPPGRSTAAQNSRASSSRHRLERRASCRARRGRTGDRRRPPRQTRGRPSVPADRLSCRSRLSRSRGRARSRRLPAAAARRRRRSARATGARMRASAVTSSIVGVGPDVDVELACPAARTRRPARSHRARRRLRRAGRPSGSRGRGDRADRRPCRAARPATTVTTGTPAARSPRRAARSASVSRVDRRKPDRRGAPGRRPVERDRVITAPLHGLARRRAPAPAALRHDAQRHGASRIAASAPAASRSDRRRRRRDSARDRASKLSGDAPVDVVRVQLIGLAAEPAERLHAKHERRFGLRAAALQLVGRSARRRRSARSPRESPCSSSSSVWPGAADATI